MAKKGHKLVVKGGAHEHKGKGKRGRKRGRKGGRRKR